MLALFYERVQNVMQVLFFSQQNMLPNHPPELNVFDVEAAIRDYSQDELSSE